MPVRVWKHCRRKSVVSRTSIPEGGSGRSSLVGVLEERELSEERVLVCEVEGRLVLGLLSEELGMGFRRVDMAWTLVKRVSG